MAISEPPVRTNDRRSDRPSIPVHQVRFEIAECEKVCDRAEDVLIQPTEQFNAHKAAQDPVYDRQHHDGREEEKPTKRHLFGDTCPYADKGAIDKLLARGVRSALDLPEDQEEQGGTEAPCIPWPCSFHSHPEVSFCGPELEEAKGLDEARPKKDQGTDEHEGPNSLKGPGCFRIV